MKILKAIRLFVLSIFFFLLFTLFISYLYVYSPANNIPSDEIIAINIPRGTSFSGIMDTLQNHELINSREQFFLTAKFQNKIHSLQAGHFKLCGGLNYFDLINELQHATQKQLSVTIPEGMEMSEIATLLEKKLKIPSEDFMQLKDSVNLFFPEKYHLKSLEGCLYPDTYYFYKNIKAKEVIRRMTSQLNKLLKQENVMHDADSLKLSLNKVLTMASIIQGEIIYDSEMSVVSAVYWNRVRKWMPLQADPTIQYIIPGPDIRLRNRHLDVESPYNTYKHYGLPPGPINNPGIKAIKAALFPSDDKYLYFVAIGDGYHKFSNTLSEHNVAKKDFQKYRRKIYYQKKRQQNK